MAKHLAPMSDRTKHYEQLRRDYYHYMRHIRQADWTRGYGKHRA